VVVSSRTRGVVGGGDGENEAHGPVDQCVAWADREEQAFDQLRRTAKSNGAAIDVFDIEPLPPVSPLPALDNDWQRHLGLRIAWSYKLGVRSTRIPSRILGKWLDTRREERVLITEGAKRAH